MFLYIRVLYPAVRQLCRHDRKAEQTTVIAETGERNSTMEKYVKPEMEIVELDYMVITASGCIFGGSGNEGPGIDCDNDTW